MVTALILVPTVSVLLCVVALLSWSGAVVPVDDELTLPSDRAGVEQRTFGPLGTIPGARVSQAVPGQVTLECSRIPTWALVLGDAAIDVLAPAR